MTKGHMCKMKKYKDNLFKFCYKHRNSIKVWAIILLTGAMLFKGVMQIPQIYQNKKTVADLQDKIEYEKTRQQEIDDMKSKVDSDEYIEKIASEKLGLVKSNAKIFIDVSEEQ